MTAAAVVDLVYSCMMNAIRTLGGFVLRVKLLLETCQPGSTLVCLRKHHIVAVIVSTFKVAPIFAHVSTLSELRIGNRMSRTHLKADERSDVPSYASFRQLV